MTAVATKPKRAAAMSPVADPHMRAFLDISGPEVFHSVAAPSFIWQPDKFDVEAIHASARRTFERLLIRATRTPQRPTGAVFVVTGQAGCGKTHLMRAFRNRVHVSGSGYCCYMQMTSEIGDYSRYMLNNLIDGLDQPYLADGQTTGLMRLTTSLFDQLGVPASQREDYRDEDTDAVPLTVKYANAIQATQAFAKCDLKLIQVLLHFQRNAPAVRSRVLMWLRCQDMTPDDLAMIGQPATADGRFTPIELLKNLARLCNALSNSCLVFLVDQLEDMANQTEPQERFNRIVDTITAVTDQIPNTVAVMACLEDYYKKYSKEILASKRDRLQRDPEPNDLHLNLQLDEALAIAESRLKVLYDESGVTAPMPSRIYPFAESDFVPLSGARARDVLYFMSRHQSRCFDHGEWIKPTHTPIDPPDGGDQPPFAALWNDFAINHQSSSAVPKEESEFAGVLASAIRDIAAELPEGNVYGSPQSDERYIELELDRPEGGLVKTLVAVCNKGAAGGGLLNQLKAVEQRAGQHSVSIVRTIGFPKKGQTTDFIGVLVRNHGCTVEVQDTDWRRMMAFAGFREKYKTAAGFDSWQKDAKPLGELASLQKLLRLKDLKPRQRQVVPVESPPDSEAEVFAAPAAAVPVVPPAPAPKTTPAEETARLVAEKIKGGDTLGIAPKPVLFDPKEFTCHAAFLGSSGSGKTTAALNIIEQLLAQGVPAILIDRKGDLSRYAEPAAWERKLSHESRVAAREKLKAKLDVVVYTPGEQSGRPLALPVIPPGFEQLGEDDRERFARYAASALGSMMNMKSSHPDQVQRVILAKAIETLAATPDAKIDLPNLRAIIGERDTALMARLGDSFQESYFTKLAERLQTLALSNSFLFKGGEFLNVEALLGVGGHAKPGRVKLSIINTKFLGSDEAIQFWVSQFLIAVGRYCAKQPKPHLQAVLMFDEADKYLPAVGKPATKEPMEDLLKRARSAGVGVFLATQSPGDLDYKCRENLLTWFVGKIGQDTAIEKLKAVLASRATSKLGQQPTGHFTLVRDGGGVVEMKSFESLLKTDQLSEAEILDLARRGRPAG